MGSAPSFCMTWDSDFSLWPTCPRKQISWCASVCLLPAPLWSRVWTPAVCSKGSNWQTELPGACLSGALIMITGWSPGLVLAMGENKQRRLGVTGWEYRRSEIRAPWHCSPDSACHGQCHPQSSGHRSLSSRRQRLPFKPFYQPSRGCELTLAKAANREGTFFEALRLFDSWKCYVTLDRWFVFISMSVYLQRHVSWILMCNHS